MPKTATIRIDILLLTLCIGLSTYSVCNDAQHLPALEAPIGIDNHHGSCYISATLQIINAIHAAIPQTAQTVLMHSSQPLLQAYVQTLHTTMQLNPYNDEGFALNYTIIDPLPFIKSWLMTDPNKRDLLTIERSSSSAIPPKIMGPWEKAASGGATKKVLHYFLRQWNITCDEQHIANPFTFSLVSPTVGTLADGFVVDSTALNNGKTNNHTGEAIITAATWYPNIQDIKIEKAPEIMIVYNWEDTPLLPHHTLKINTNDNTTHTYQCLAIAYGAPIFSKKTGCVTNHTFAVVRYHTNFYLCNDDRIMPFVNEQAAYRWMDDASTISYQSLSNNTDMYNAIIPMIIVYQKIPYNPTAPAL